MSASFCSCALPSSHLAPPPLTYAAAATVSDEARSGNAPVAAKQKGAMNNSDNIRSGDALVPVLATYCPPCGDEGVAAPMCSPHSGMRRQEIATIVRPAAMRVSPPLEPPPHH